MYKMNKTIVYFTILTVIFLMIISILYFFNKNNMLLLILMFTPALSVLLAKSISKEKFDDLYLKLNFKNNIKYYFLAYLSPPFIAFVGAILYFIIFKNDFDPLGSPFAKQVGANDIQEYTKTIMMMLPIAILLNPIANLVACLGEELAWRGFLLPRLLKAFTTRKAIILNGIIWGLWHAPIVAMGYNYGSEHPLMGVLAMLMFCVVIGTISSYLFIKTKSIWPSVILHAAINGISLYSPSLLLMSKTPNMFIGPDLLGFIGGIGFILIAILILLKTNKKIEL